MNSEELLNILEITVKMEAMTILNAKSWRNSKIKYSRILRLLIVTNIVFIFAGCGNKGYNKKLSIM
jgi:hypothetical protein